MTRTSSSSDRIRMDRARNAAAVRRSAREASGLDFDHSAARMAMVLAAAGLGAAALVAIVAG